MHQCWVGKRSSEMGSTFRPGRGREYGENTWHRWVGFWKVHRVWIRRWVGWPQWGIELRETEMSHSFGKQCWETIFSLNTYWESVRHSKLNTKWELSDTQSDKLFKNAGEFCLEHKWTSLADKNMISVIQKPRNADTRAKWKAGSRVCSVTLDLMWITNRLRFVLYCREQRRFPIWQKKANTQSQKQIRVPHALHLNELSGGFGDCHRSSKGLSMRTKDLTRTAFLSMLTILFSLGFPLAFCNCSYLWSKVVWKY